MAASGTVTRGARRPPSRRRGRSSGWRRSWATGRVTSETERLWRQAVGKYGSSGNARSRMQPWESLPARSAVFRLEEDRPFHHFKAPRAEANLGVQGHRIGRMAPDEGIEPPAFGLQTTGPPIYSASGPKPHQICVSSEGAGLLEGIRTPDLRFRKPLLYPAELPGGDQLAFGACSVLDRTDTASCVCSGWPSAVKSIELGNRCSIRLSYRDAGVADSVRPLRLI